MNDENLPPPIDLEVVRALHALSRDPAAKAQATQILREELRSATTAERAQLIAAITLLDRVAAKAH
jgi:hypothetical protein